MWKMKVVSGLVTLFNGRSQKIHFSKFLFFSGFYLSLSTYLQSVYLPARTYHFLLLFCLSFQKEVRPYKMLFAPKWKYGNKREKLLHNKIYLVTGIF